MDVGFYLGEFLVQQGEVKVAGLGNFSQIRMSAYYDEREELFYPPYNKVHFEPQVDVDNDELAEYLVAKKHISLTSAKYFIQKYVANLRLQAIVADVPLGNMGYFFTDRSELSFRPNDRLLDDSELYGYVPIRITKLSNASARQHQSAPETAFSYHNTEEEKVEFVNKSIEPVSEKTFTPVAEEKFAPIAEEKVSPLVADKFEDSISSNYVEPFSNHPEETLEPHTSSAYDEAFLDLPEEEEERSGPLRSILISLVIVAVLAVGVLALYMYSPDTFNKLQFWKNDQPVTAVETRPNTIEVPALDTANTDSADNTLNDTTSVVAADTIARARFELITGKGFKNLWAANEAVKKYKAMGLLNAKLAEDRPGKLIKISLGNFTSISESEAFKQKLIKEGKLNKWAYTIEIPEQN
ncbi:HU domain-containing protein [Mucilaginibacter sp. HD30]